MIRHFHKLLYFATVVLLAVLTPAAAPAAPTNGACSPTKLKFSASALNFSSTTSVAYGNIPETLVNFVQGAAGGCVIVRFSAQANVPNDEAVSVRALLDGATVAIPDGVNFLGQIAEGPFSGVHSYEFVFPSVAPGSRKIRMQFKSNFGGSVTVHRHTTIVQHAP